MHIRGPYVLKIRAILTWIGQTSVLTTQENKFSYKWNGNSSSCNNISSSIPQGWHLGGSPWSMFQLYACPHRSSSWHLKWRERHVYISQTSAYILYVTNLNSTRKIHLWRTPSVLLYRLANLLRVLEKGKSGAAQHTFLLFLFAPKWYKCLVGGCLVKCKHSFAPFFLY
jgi:hypothetical protein